MQAMDESLPDSSLSTPTKRTDFCPTFSYLHRCALWINMLMYFARFSILSQPRLALLLEKWACSAAASKHRACASPNGQPLWLCACWCAPDWRQEPATANWSRKTIELKTVAPACKGSLISQDGPVRPQQCRNLALAIATPLAQGK